MVCSVLRSTAVIYEGCGQEKLHPYPAPKVAEAHPLSPIHDPSMKVWLVAMYLLIARASPAIRLAIAGTVAVATVANFPPRLWQSQLWRLSLLCGFLFLSTLFLVDGMPPVLQVRWWGQRLGEMGVSTF